MHPPQAAALRIHIPVRVEVREIPHLPPGRRNRTPAVCVQRGLVDQRPSPPSSQTVQHLLYKGPEADGRAALRRLSHSLRTHPQSSQCRVAVDRRRLRMAVCAWAHACHQRNLAGELVPDEIRVLGPGCVQTFASHPGFEIIQLHDPSAGHSANHVCACVLWAKNAMKRVDYDLIKP